GRLRQTRLHRRRKEDRRVQEREPEDSNYESGPKRYQRNTGRTDPSAGGPPAATGVRTRQGLYRLPLQREPRATPRDLGSVSAYPRLRASDFRPTDRCVATLPGAQPRPWAPTSHQP